MQAEIMSPRSMPYDMTDSAQKMVTLNHINYHLAVIAYENILIEQISRQQSGAEVSLKNRMYQVQWAMAGSLKVLKGLNTMQLTG